MEKLFKENHKFIIEMTKGIALIIIPSFILLSFIFADNIVRNLKDTAQIEVDYKKGKLEALEGIAQTICVYKDLNKVDACLGVINKKINEIEGK